LFGGFSEPEVLLKIASGPFMQPANASSLSPFGVLILVALAGSAWGQTAAPSAVPCRGKGATIQWHVYVNREHKFCFLYPDTYTPVPLQDDTERSKYFPLENNVLQLKRRGVDATIHVLFNGPFNLERLRISNAPTGMIDIPPDPVRIGRYTFYRYGAGGGGVSYPDQYFFNLRGKTLEIDFDGPYETSKSPSAETEKLEPIMLATLRML
jgi:hypothetical protein